VIQRGARNEFGPQCFDRIHRQQPIARGRHHHGIEHDNIAGDHRVKARTAMASIVEGCATIPILTA